MSASDFLTGAGRMGTRIREHDWLISPLGPAETWPPALRLTLSLMLQSRFPAYIMWGPDLISFYNDAYWPLLGSKPEPLGKPLRQVWPEIWDRIRPIVEGAMAGKPSYFEDMPLALERHGYPEQTWWTFAYSSIRDEAGDVRGVLAIVQETTRRVVTERRLRFLVGLKGRLRDLADPRAVMATAAEMLGHYLEADRVGYGEIDPDGENLSVGHDWSADPDATFAGRYRLADFGPKLIEDLRAGRTVLIHDESCDPRTADAHIAAEFIRTGKRAAIIVPLVRDGRWLACLYVHQSEPRHWREDEVTVAEEVAERTWTAVLRARAEAALRESEERYRQLSEAVPHIVWSADAEGRTDFFNSRWFAYTGLPNQPGCFDGWEAAIHPEDYPHVQAARAEAMQAGRSTELEYRLRRADGAYRWHLSRAVPVRDDQGRIVRWFGTLTDIDDRRRAEEALRESEERFRQFARNSASVLWTLDVATMRLEFLSPSFQQVWGESPEAAPRDFARWAETVHPDDRETAFATLDRMRAGEVAVWEYRIVRPDGTVRWVQNTGFPIRDEHGQVVRVAGIAQDITRHDGSMVYVVDGDETSRRAAALLLQGAGYQVKVFNSAPAFLDVAPVLVPGCVVLDTCTSETEELRIPKELKARRLGLPVIVIGEAHGEVAVGVQAMKAGAVDFVDAPYRPAQLLEAVATALASIQDLAERDQAAELAKARIAGLPTREREVLDRLVAGGTNKTIARELGISPRTVEAYRARIMERLGAHSLPELVQTAVAAGLQTLS